MLFGGRRPAHPASLASLLLLLLSGCGEAGKPEPPADSAQALGSLAREATDLTHKLEFLMSQDWLPRDKLRPAFAARRIELDGFLQAFARSGQDPGARERLLEQGRRALPKEGDGVTSASELLLGATDSVLRCLNLRRDMLTYIERSKVPPDAPFALRNRFQEGWLPENTSWTSDLFKGAEELLAGVASQRGPIAARNLERSVSSGSELLMSMQVLFRRVQSIERKLGEALPGVAEYARRVLEKGRERLAAGSAPEGVTKETLDGLDAGRQELLRDLPAAASEWPDLRAAVFAGGAGWEKKLEAFEKRVHDMKSGLFERAIPPGRALGLAPPGSEKL